MKDIGAKTRVAMPAASTDGLTVTELHRAGLEQRWVFLATLLGSMLTTGLVVTPVAMHRLLFRQRRRELIVEMANRCALAGLATLALTVWRGIARGRRRRGARRGRRDGRLRAARLRHPLACRAARSGSPRRPTQPAAE